MEHRLTVEAKVFRDMYLWDLNRVWERTATNLKLRLLLNAEVVGFDENSVIYLGISRSDGRLEHCLYRNSTQISYEFHRHIGNVWKSPVFQLYLTGAT